MRHIFTLTAAGLIAGLAAWGSLAAAPPTKEKPAELCTDGTCGQYGTSVSFVKTPSEAARQALKEEKLVFVLHVSGNFEDPDFT